LPRIEREGRYYRVVDPTWRDPFDGSDSRQRGGRWNAPNTFPVVYLNRDISTARAFVMHKFRGLPYGPELLRPDQAPMLVATDLARDTYVDVVTEAGCVAVGLPATYPLDATGALVPWAECQPIGQRVWDAGERGIACRSASLPGGVEELAYFTGAETARLEESSRWQFHRWFWPERS
jgi:RES domain-containing protein